jgi:hypothetical protein
MMDGGGGGGGGEREDGEREGRKGGERGGPSILYLSGVINMACIRVLYK